MKNKLFRPFTTADFLLNEKYIDSFINSKPVIQENRTKSGWLRRGRVPYYVSKLNSAFNIR